MMKSERVMDFLSQDVRYAMRQLIRNPGLTTIVALTLALGIGANTAIFSVVNGVLLRPLPFDDSERLAFLPRIGDREGDLSIPDGRDLREGCSSFDSIALFMPFWAFDLTGVGQPERIRGSVVEVRPALLLLLGAVGLVLLVTCVNVANLLLVRAVTREREIAIRRALGAGGARVARQLLAESVALSILGGILGVLGAVWAQDLLIRLAPADLARIGDIGLDATVLGFATVLCLSTGWAFGLLPAFFAARSDTGSLLRGAGSKLTPGPRRQNFLGAFATAEVALAFVLLMAAALLTRSFLQLQRVELGFQPDGVVAANLVLPESRYSEPSRQTQAFRQMLDAVASLPGVESAAFVIGAPLADFGAIGHSLVFDDRPPPDPSEQPSARNRPVLGDYFKTMKIRVLRGRGISWQDEGTAPPVAVVNESFARRFWPDTNPLDKRLAWQPPQGQEPRWMRVVGVAADVKTSSLKQRDDVAVYTSYLQRDEPWQRFGTLVTRTAVEPASVAQSLREAVWSVDPALPVDRVATMEELVRGSLDQERFNTWAIAAFGLVALAIALQGVYGVVSYVVAQRRNEIGIRIAMGAERSDILRLFVARGVRVAGVGLLLGWVATLPTRRWLASLLYGISATDGPSYLGATALLAVAVLVASYLPARRAATTNPVEALRHE